MNKYFDLVMAALFIYEAVVYLTKRDGMNPRMAERYTKESIEKYSIFEGITCLIGAVVIGFGCLADFGVINIGFAPNSSYTNTLIFTGIWFVIICLPSLYGYFKVLKPLSGKRVSRRQRRLEEAEDF